MYKISIKFDYIIIILDQHIKQWLNSCFFYFKMIIFSNQHVLYDFTNSTLSINNRGAYLHNSFLITNIC